MGNLKRISQVFLTSLLFIAISCNSHPKPATTDKEGNKNDTIYKVTFIELGSVRCIPCQKMQPVMKSIKERFGTQVNVVFHDVWTAEGAPNAEKYGVKLIPTQVFLDQNGKEYFRHAGFFPEEDVVAILKMKGVN
jgi:thioredoxin 1